MTGRASHHGLKLQASSLLLPKDVKNRASMCDNSSVRQVDLDLDRRTIQRDNMLEIVMGKVCSGDGDTLQGMGRNGKYSEEGEYWRKRDKMVIRYFKNWKFT